MPLTSDGSIMEITPGRNVRSEAEYALIERCITRNGRQPLLSIADMMAEEPGCDLCGGVLREVETETGAGLRTFMECEIHGEMKSC